MILFPCLPNKALIPRANMMTYTQAVPSTPSVYSIVIFHYKIKPQSALYSKFSHQQQLVWMQLRQASRDKLHIKAAPDEIWSILIVSGSTECLILLTTTADDIWGELHLTRSQKPECLYNYQHSEIQGDLVLNECSLLIHCVSEPALKNIKCIASYRFPSPWIIISLETEAWGSVQSGERYLSNRVT